MEPVKSTRDIIVRTEHVEQASTFYEDVLGLAVFQRDAMVGIETGAFRLFVEHGPAHGPVLEFLVDDLAARKAQLVAAGCTVMEEDPSVPRCYIRDPFGLVFNLSQR